MSRVISIYEDIAKSGVGVENFVRVAGIPTAGIPFSSVLSYNLSKPFLYVRKEAKTHGRERRIEGVLSPGDKVLMVDDLITSGRSVIESVNIVRGEGGTVSDVVVLIDREEGGEQNLSKVEVKLHSFTKISEISKELYEADLIDKRQYEEIVKQSTRKP
jgi:orotate phosphoribosyltransferase